MIVSPNLGLTVWDSDLDPYDHEQLAANWLKVDQHDHSGGGRGLPIGTNAIADGAVTSEKLDPGAIPPLAIPNLSITTAMLINDAVSTIKIQDGAVTKSKLASDVGVNPVGAITAWGGQIGSEPAGWLLCNGQIILQSTYSDLYAAIGATYNWKTGETLNTSTQFRVPDFRGRFPVGVNTGVGYLNSGGITEGVYGSGGTPKHSHTVPPELLATNYGLGTGLLAREIHLNDSGSIDVRVQNNDGSVLNAGGGSTDLGSASYQTVNFLIFTGVF